MFYITDLQLCYLIFNIKTLLLVAAGNDDDDNILLVGDIVDLKNGDKDDQDVSTFLILFCFVSVR